MGSLAWLRYLSHTQVIEGSNLSPSIVEFKTESRRRTLKIRKKVSLCWYLFKNQPTEMCYHQRGKDYYIELIN